MTEDQEKGYLENSNTCPFCQSNDSLSGGMVEVDDNRAWQDVTCIVCGERWTDLYTLTGVIQEQ